MKADDIKRYLKPYSMTAMRTTTINNAFASALAPCDVYDVSRIGEAMAFLGQDVSALTCVYCDEPAQTWDHLVGLVKNSQLRGFGHQLGNLVPCCKACNGRKGSRDWTEFVANTISDSNRRELLLRRLSGYVAQFAKLIDLKSAETANPVDWNRYQELRQEVIALLKEADTVATRLRVSIVPRDI